VSGGHGAARQRAQDAFKTVLKTAFKARSSRAWNALRRA
jgi:hypothetical protein